MGVGARDDRFAGFDRLAQRIQNRALELRKLVKEQNTEVRQRDFPGFDAHAAADQCGHRRGVMRCAERSPPRDGAVAQFAGERLDHRDFERLARVKRRENAGQARASIDFPAPGGPIISML